MKKKWIGILLVVVFTCMTGCNNREDALENMESSTNGASDLFEEVIKSGTLIDFSGEKEHKGLCETLEQKEENEQGKYNTFNRMKTGNAEQDSLFCIDETTGIVYFVNQNQDWYIYRIKEKSVELAVALPAKELYIWDGTIYFMLESYDKYEFEGAIRGDIFSYTPIDGSIELVYAAGSIMGNQMQRLYVDDSGIFFSCATEETVKKENIEYQVLREKYYHLPFGATEPVEDVNKTTQMGWKDYCLSYRMEEGELKLVLTSKELNSHDIVALNVGSPIQSCIVGDELYYLNNKKLAIKNLMTGEEKSYDCFSALEEAGCFRGREERLDEITILESFTVTRDYIWAKAFSFYLLRIDPYAGEIVCYRMADDYCRLGTLYTDGIHLYAEYSRSVSGVPYIVQIEEEQMVSTNETDGMNILSIKEILKCN